MWNWVNGARASEPTPTEDDPNNSLSPQEQTETPYTESQENEENEKEDDEEESDTETATKTTSSDAMQNGECPLPGYMAFKPVFDLEKDLLQCKQLYKEKYKPIIEQKFIETSQSKKSNDSVIEVSILQFNMLADALSTGYTESDNGKDFIGVDKECLRWSYRGVRIVELLNKMDTDIICLEECDQDKFLMNYLNEKYQCLYQMKANAPAQKILKQLHQERRGSLPSDYRLLNDGIFIAFRKSKFTMIGEPIRINDAENPTKIVALALQLRHKDKPTVRFLLVGTHLKSEKAEEGEKIREKQIRSLFQELSRHCDPNIPVILSCDLNANPENNKNGYEPLCYKALVNELGCESVYVRGQGKEPEFTTYKKRQHGVDKHTIDYIFLKNAPCRVSHLLQVVQDLGVDSDSSVIPNWNYPSDHFAIGCKLQWQTSGGFMSSSLAMEADGSVVSESSINGQREPVGKFNSEHSVGKFDTISLQDGSLADESTCKATLETYKRQLEYERSEKEKWKANLEKVHQQNISLEKAIQELIEHKKIMTVERSKQKKTLQEFENLHKQLEGHLTEAKEELNRQRAKLEEKQQKLNAILQSFANEDINRNNNYNTLTTNMKKSNQKQLPQQNSVKTQQGRNSDSLSGNVRGSKSRPDQNGIVQAYNNPISGDVSSTEM